MSQMLEFALYYLSMGWSIIPQRPGDKKPLVKWKRFQELPPDRAQVEEWWTRWPDAGICLVLGSVSGLVAVDVDSSEAERVFFELQGGEPTTLKSLSGSRKSSKAHYLFHCPDFPTTAKYTPLNKQLEFRGHGGYIVLPPSLHHSGNRYAWSEPLQPIAALPEALDAVWRANPRFAPKTPRPSRRRPNLRIDSGATDAPDIIAQDEPASLITILRLAGLADSTQKWLIGCFSHQAGWNQNLFCAACDLAGLGVPMEEAEPLLLYGARPDTAADEQQARRTIQSAYAEPRIPLREYAAMNGTLALRNPPKVVSDHDGVRLLGPLRLRRRLNGKG